MNNVVLAKNNSEIIYYSKFKEIGSASSFSADKNEQSSSLCNTKLVLGGKKSSQGKVKAVKASPTLDPKETLLVKRAVQGD